MDVDTCMYICTTGHVSICIYICIYMDTYRCIYTCVLMDAYIYMSVSRKKEREKAHRFIRMQWAKGRRWSRNVWNEVKWQVRVRVVELDGDYEYRARDTTTSTTVLLWIHGKKEGRNQNSWGEKNPGEIKLSIKKLPWFLYSSCFFSSSSFAVSHSWSTELSSYFDDRVFFSFPFLSFFLLTPWTWTLLFCPAQAMDIVDNGYGGAFS